MTRIVAAALSRLAVSASADLAYPIAQRRSAAASGLRAPAWLLKAGSVCTALVVLAGGMGYATSHVYSASAPLQPPVAKASPTATPSVRPVTNAQTGGLPTLVLPLATIAPRPRPTGRHPPTPPDPPYKPAGPPRRARPPPA